MVFSFAGLCIKLSRHGKDEQYFKHVPGDLNFEFFFLNSGNLVFTEFSFMLFLFSV